MAILPPIWMQRERYRLYAAAALPSSSSSSSSSSFLFLLLLLLLLPSFSLTQQHPTEDYFQCTRNTTSPSSTFTRNLNTALSNFTSLSLKGSKYDTTTVGSSGQDMVYAVFQCRGDMSLKSCSDCMLDATDRLPQRNCPKFLGARIWLDTGCFLRYDNQPFFVLNTTYITAFCDRPATGNDDAINAVVDKVMSQAPKQGGFASGSAGDFYGAAQCLGYLTQSACSQCLSAQPYRTRCKTVDNYVFLDSCYYRYASYNFLEALPSPALSPTSGLLDLRPSPPGDSHGSKTHIIIIAGIMVMGLGALCALILLWRYKARKKRGSGVQRVDKAASWSQELVQTNVKEFSLEELKKATDHFHPTNKLGEGGFGIVYKGTLLGGEEVAIKKLSIGSQQGKQEFLNEVRLITSVQHKNLVRLLGHCVEDSERILVFEYLPNKSLDFFLYEKSREGRVLNWSTRYGVIIGMARGLSYLHEESHIPIIHRDIKPSNILLDDQLNPVITDFGLAKLFNQNATHVNTRVAGTIGYIAPEYALGGALSPKVDVFSFGMVSLELIVAGGNQNIPSTLLKWVWEKFLREQTLDIVDEKLGNDFFPQEVIRVVHVALLCTQENPKQRPTMSLVTQWLGGTSDILEIPTRPAFLDYNDSISSMGELHHLYDFTSSTFHSTNVSTSQLLERAQSLSEVLDAG